MIRRKRVNTIRLLFYYVYIKNLRHLPIVYGGVRLTSQNCDLYVSLVHPRVLVMWTMVRCY
jgi:hypothetical protein